MRLRPSVALFGLALVASACSSASTTATAAPQPAVVAAPAVNPVGRWAVALSAQGQALDVTLELRHIGGAEYGGSITSQMFPPVSVSRATLTGNVLRMIFVAPTGDEATMSATFEGDTFTGEWAMPGDGSRISGRRIP